MFTGIIEAIGTLSQLTTEGTNTHFYFSSPLTAELKVDQSLAHDGVCLTVVEVTSEGISGDSHCGNLAKDQFVYLGSG